MTQPNVPTYHRTLSVATYNGWLILASINCSIPEHIRDTITGAGGFASGVCNLILYKGQKPDEAAEYITLSRERYGWDIRYVLKEHGDSTPVRQHMASTNGEMLATVRFLQQHISGGDGPDLTKAGQ